MNKKYDREQIITGNLKGQYYVLPEEIGEKYYTLSDLTKNTKRWIVEKYFPPHDALLSPRYGTQEQQNKIDLRKLWYRETIDQNQWIQDNYAFVYGGQDYEKTSSGKDCLIFYSEPGVGVDRRFVSPGATQNSVTFVNPFFSFIDKNYK